MDTYLPPKGFEKNLYRLKCYITKGDFIHLEFANSINDIKQCLWLHRVFSKL